MLSYFLFKISKSDLDSFQIPDEYTLAIAILGIPFISIERIILAEIMIILTGLVLGFGDAKLFGAISLLLGRRVFLVAALSFGLCSIYCIFGLLKKELKLKDKLAFAPFISVACVSVFLTCAL